MSVATGIAAGLHGKTVLVTGATGFLGGRLVERLLLEEGAQVRALARNYSTAVWLSRTTSDVVLGDITAADSLEEPLRGCDVVFHCAAQLGGDPEQMQRVNVMGTGNLLKAAAEIGVSRFVYVSSLAVHGSRFPDGADENSPLQPGRDPYAQSKLAAEKLVAQYSERFSLPVVILRPSLVYGPRSQWWAVDPLQRIEKSRLALLGRGRGVANVVYVDDVIDALLLAAQAPAAVGEAFLISSEERITWGRFFGAYAAMLDRSLPAWPAAVAWPVAAFTGRLDRAIESLKNSGSSPRSLRLWTAVALRGVRRLASPLYKLGAWELGMYHSQAQVSVAKARHMLDYRSRWPLGEAMAETEVWLQAQGYLAEPEARVV